LSYIIGQMTEKKPITAWTVVRVAPGLRDDGVKIGPFFKEEEADEWIDENHKKVFLKEVEFGLHKNIENYEILIQGLLNDLAYLQYVFSHDAGYETSIGEKTLEFAFKLGFKPNAKTDEELYKEAMENIPQESLERMDKILKQIDENEKANN